MDKKTVFVWKKIVDCFLKKFIQESFWPQPVHGTKRQKCGGNGIKPILKDLKTSNRKPNIY